MPPDLKRISEILGFDVDYPCPCVGKDSPRETLHARPGCLLCEGTGTPDPKQIARSLNAAAGRILDLASDCAELSDLLHASLMRSWWIAEDSYRKLSGEACSFPHKKGGRCQTCVGFRVWRGR